MLLTRERFLRAIGVAGGIAVGNRIAALPRYREALAGGTGVLRRVAAMAALRVGVNGPFAFHVDVGDFVRNTNQIFVVREASGAVHALEATCRHRGCPVAWEHDVGKFVCPCHGSQYTIAGRVTHGPAHADLYRHAVVVRAGQVWVRSARADT